MEGCKRRERGKVAVICKKQRAAACGAHVLFNMELLRERTGQAWMGLSQQWVDVGRDRWG